MKLKHILLTTDLSEEAVRPFAAISELARTTGARVTLLHVVPDLMAVPHGAPFAPKQSSPDLPKHIAHARVELKDQWDNLHDGIPVEMEVTGDEDVAGAICRYADAHEVDLIALSTHGRTGFKHLVLGSVAESVLRHSTVPVLTFPRTAK